MNKTYLPYGSTGKPGRNAHNRLFIDALLWMARSPERFGRFDSVKRHYLWVEAGVLEAVNEIGAIFGYLKQFPAGGYAI